MSESSLCTSTQRTPNSASPLGLKIPKPFLRSDPAVQLSRLRLVEECQRSLTTGDHSRETTQKIMVWRPDRPGSYTLICVASFFSSSYSGFPPTVCNDILGKVDLY